MNFAQKQPVTVQVKQDVPTTVFKNYMNFFINKFKLVLFFLRGVIEGSDSKLKLGIFDILRKNCGKFF